MELVEIVVRVEEAFGIEISNADAVKLKTTREVADYVAKKVAVSDEQSCLSQQAFYFLRDSFGKYFQVSREISLPHSRLEDIIPRERRREKWTVFRTKIGAHAIPDLARPIWMFCALAISTVLVLIYAIRFTDETFSGVYAFAFGVMVAVAFGTLTAIATRPAKNNFRRHLGTVGEMVNHLATKGPDVIKRGGRTWTRDQILAVVHKIVAESGVPNDFSDDARFVEDLRLG